MAAITLALAQAASSPRLVDKIRTCFDRFLAEGFFASGEHDFRTSLRGRGVVRTVWFERRRAIGFKMKNRGTGEKDGSSTSCGQGLVL